MKLKLTLTLSLVSGIIFLAVIFSGNPLGRVLSLEKPLHDARFLLVEGWLNKKELGYAGKEFKTGRYQYIITTGIKSPEFYEMGLVGNLAFTIHSNFVAGQNITLQVTAYGTRVGNEPAKFEAFINDSSMGITNTEIYPVSYPFHILLWDTLKIVTLRFLNDAGRTVIFLFLRSALIL